MNAKTQGTVAIAAALFVLLSALWDPRISVAISVVALIALGLYAFVHKNK